MDKVIKSVKESVANLFYGLKLVVATLLFKCIQIDEDKIVIDSFLGKGYGDNPKYICDEIMRRSDSCKIIWLCRDMNAVVPNGVKKVKYGSFQSLREYFSAKIWIDNVRNSYKPRKKKKGQIYLQTWHGFLPFKFIEAQMNTIDNSYKKAALRDAELCDAIISSNSAITQIMQDSFWLADINKIKPLGSPESDMYFNENVREEALKHIKSHYGLLDDSIIILYMPTFRDDSCGNIYNLDFELLQKAFVNKYKKDCTILIRMHPNVKKRFMGNETKNIIDVSDYSDANELICCSDLLISDYSSVIYIQILLDKPVLLYTPDEERYEQERGLNDCYKDLPCPKAKTMEKLLQNIDDFSYEDYQMDCIAYRSKTVAYNIGKSSREVVDWLMEKKEQIQLV